MDYFFAGEGNDARSKTFIAGLDGVLREHGHDRCESADEASLILNPFPWQRPRPARRQRSAVFVVGLTSFDEEFAGELEQAQDAAGAIYPKLVSSLSNLLIALSPEGANAAAHLVTPEKGHVRLPAGRLDDAFFQEIYARMEPIVTSTLVIHNLFVEDLEPELWQGDEGTAGIARAGRYLDELKLMPAPFPIENLLTPRGLRHLKKMYGIGGLSYGNFSARLDANRFWMSASGVDKSKLEAIGRDILLVSGYVPEENAMRISVPQGVEPRRASVDAIEHWLIYQENPGVQAILHVHAWMEGVVSTELTYPCGTYEMGRAVADLVRTAPDPVHAVIGLRNHGLTSTGTSMDEILARVSGKLVRNVPMT